MNLFGKEVIIRFTCSCKNTLLAELACCLWESSFGGERQNNNIRVRSQARRGGIQLVNWPRGGRRADSAEAAEGGN